MVDLYCERVEPGLWAEPLNASTNLAFFVAAWTTWRLAHRLRRLSASIWVLIGLVVTIGIGSILFHTFATTWARVLDAVPILLFQLLYLWLYSREIINLRFGNAVGLLVAFVVAGYLGRQFPHILNGSLIYAPAFLLIVGLGLYHYREEKHERFAVLAAAAVFLVAVFFRTIDNGICPSLPVGTHFLWHLLISVVLYLFVRGLLSNMPNRPGAA